MVGIAERACVWSVSWILVRTGTDSTSGSVCDRSLAGRMMRVRGGLRG